MPTKQVRVQLTVNEDLSGLARARSALDDFNQSAAQGFSKTRSAIDDLSKNGVTSVGNLKQQIADLQKVTQGAQQAVVQNTQAQTKLNQELQAGTVTGAQHASVLKQLQERQKLLAQEAKSAQQTFRAARMELQDYLGGAFAASSVGASALPGNLGLGASGGGMIYSHRTPNLATAMGLPPTTPIGNILGGLFSHGIGPISGRGLAWGGFTLGAATIGNQNRAVSTLGGLASGAMIGTSILPGIGTAIGAAIGGIVGLFTGGGGKNKTHDADIANQGFAELHQILDDYYNFRRNYASAVDDANKVWQQMVKQWVRRESAPSQRPYFDQVITAMQQTEDERNRRRQLQSLLPVPEFAQGGSVGGSGGGVLAMLHSGEFVMTRQAVERIGSSVLQGMNQGSSGASAGQGSGFSIEPASSATLSNFLKSNPQALDDGLLVVLRRGGPASKAMRG
jgi:outer membrane lipoprotein SlyB